MSQIIVPALSNPPPPGFVETLTGNTGGAVPPDGSDNINVVGDGTTCTVAGNAGTNTLTISVISQGLTWSDQAVSFNAASNNGYFCTAALTATFPTNVSLVNGSTINIYADTASTVTIQAAPGEFIEVAQKTSVSGGTAVSNVQGNNLALVFRISDNTWHAIGPVGTWSIT